MNIKIQDNNKKVELDIELNELIGWLNIKLVDGETEEELQLRIQHKINEKYNKPEYNNWHKHNRHIGYSKAVSEDGDDSFGHFKEPLMNEVKDPNIFFKTELIQEKIESYNTVCKFIRNIYSNKPDLSEIMIKAWIDGFTIREIARSRVIKEKNMSDEEYKNLVKKEENNLSKKLNRSKEKFKKVLQKTSDFNIPRGYLVERKK